MKTLVRRARRKIRRALSRSQPQPPPGVQIIAAGEQPAWRQMIGAEWNEWLAAVRAAKSGPRVLIATSMGHSVSATTIESALAVALTLRGARAEFLLCDQFLPACQEAMFFQAPSESHFAEFGPSHYLCPACFVPAEQALRVLGLPVLRYSQFVSRRQAQIARDLAHRIPFQAIPEYKWEGLAVGEHALAGALRFYARGNLEGQLFAEPIQRRYLHAALLTTFGMQTILNRASYLAAVFNHGIYVPQGLVGEVARQKHVRVVNWVAAYRKQRFIFSHNDTYHHVLLDEPVSNWENIAWSEHLGGETIEYLKSRWEGSQDWIWFHENPENRLETIARQLGIDPARPMIGLLTNVMWDAQLHYRANAFENMLDWVIQTIRYFARRRDLQLIIRIHPAEVRGTIPSRQPLMEEIKKAFPELPSNVFVISPESNISTYAVLEPCNAALIYGTKMGVELTSIGMPVIVAGEAWIRNKGMTLDARTPQEYFELLDQLPFASRMSKERTERARKYAFHFFFRRMIPLEFVEPTGSWPPYRLAISSLAQLAPGASPGLDVICDGILKGTEFIFPAEAFLESNPRSDGQTPIELSRQPQLTHE